MKTVASILVITLFSFLAVPARAAEQVPADIWRELATKLKPGSVVVVDVKDGPRVKATFVRAADEGITIVPKTRVAVPPQVVAYDTIEVLEADSRKEASVGKAVAIGVASGVGAFFLTLMIMVASIAD